VEPGWETAFEAVLRERVQGVEVGRLDTIGGLAADAPPARVAFYSTSGAVARELSQMPGFKRLSDLVRTHDAAFAALFADWLTNVFVADDLASALAARSDLPPGGQFVVKAAHRVSRHDVNFYAADDQAAGLLARRLEIENLEREVRAQRLIVEETTAAVARAESELRSAQQARDAARQDTERQRSQMHVLQLEAVRFEELIDRVRHRSGQIGAELSEIEANEREARSQREQADARFEQLDAELSIRQDALESARLTYEEADRALRAARDEQRALDSARQHCEFALKSSHEREADLARGAESAGVDAQRLADEIGKAEDELKQLDDSAAREGLADWLARRSAADDALRHARSHLDDFAQQLRAADEKRLTLERDVQPLREKLTELQLKEQAARLAAEQFANQLGEAQADESALAAKLTGRPPQKAAALQAEILRLAQEIEALGAVNLAALEELTTSRERKNFLDTQSADLHAAITTLEDAIRKIDRETRQMLQQTFDAVNLQFGQLFPKLFGGGDARLIMTG
ncbi:MAG: chromosome segregation protein SMC, partial [Burkholderiaceae bacterium]